ncbi:MAG: GNAT family N-acetyltransferase [Candidatus Saccharibacteria bacterium]
MIALYNDLKHSNEVESLLIDFQKYLHNIDTTNEIKEFQNEEYAKKYLTKMSSDCKEMNGKMLVSIENEKIVGFIQGVVITKDDPEDIMYATTHDASKQGWIGVLYITPEMRGKGLGTELIDSVKSYFIEQGCKTMRLLVASDNKPTIKTYHNYGFIDGDVEMSLKLF